MVDAERLRRLIEGVRADVAFLRQFADREARDLVADQLTLRGIKYSFVTAIEGCAKVAHHIAAAEGWPSAETNADAVRDLGRQGVLERDLAAAVGDAVGFRNLLVHQYADVDDDRAVAHLQRLGDLDAFVAAVARWLGDVDPGA